MAAKLRKNKQDPLSTNIRTGTYDYLLRSRPHPNSPFYDINSVMQWDDIEPMKIGYDSGKMWMICGWDMHYIRIIYGQDMEKIWVRCKKDMGKIW